MMGRIHPAIFPPIKSPIFPLPALPVPIPKNPKHKATITRKIRTRMAKNTQHWLLKTEPGEWSWEDQAANSGVSNWDGVKNKQAQKNLKSMKLGNLCFFYHSGAKSRRVMGVVSVMREFYSDDDNEVVVDVKAVGEMRRQVDLKEMKGDDGLKGFVLFRQPRLSVVPVTEEIWGRICELSGGYEGDGAIDGENEED